MKTRSLIITRSVDLAGFLLLASLCFGYLYRVRRFAEIHVVVPGIGLPVFVGEIAIFVSALLILVKDGADRLSRHGLPPGGSLFSFSRTPVLSGIVGLYIIFVLFKALTGYAQWGILAFRHSALFYYPVYIYFGYRFYSSFWMRRSFFAPAAAVLFLLIHRFVPFFDYMFFPTFALFLVSAISVRPLPLRFLLMGAAIWATPFQQLFSGSRTKMVANAAAVVFAGGGLLSFLKLSFKWKLALFAGLVAVVPFGWQKMADSNALKSMKNINVVFATMSYYDMHFEARKDIFRMETFDEIQVFNPEKPLPETAAVKQNVSLKKAAGEEMFSDADVKSSLSQADAGGAQRTARLVDRPVSGGRDSGKEEASQVNQGKSGKPSRPKARALGSAYNNIIFRLFIWRDMWEDFESRKSFMGMDFGHPVRSKRLEMFRWGVGEWSRDGWVGAHNSFIHFLYRSGAAGLLFLGAFFVFIFRRLREAFIRRDVRAVILFSATVYWMAAANFLLIFELPYTAIPCWVVLGLTLGYLDRPHENPYHS